MKNNVKIKSVDKSFPVVVAKDERGFFVAECPLFSGCYAQGKTIEKALEEVKIVIEMCIEEKENKNIVDSYDSSESSFHNVKVAVA